MSLRADITIKQDESVGEVLNLLRLKRGEKRAVRAFLRGADAGGSQLVGLAQKERLRGEGPFPVRDKKLGVQTRRLSRSLRSSKPKYSGGVVSLGIGTNVKYFGGHEFGLRKKVSVPAHKVKAHVKNFRGKQVAIPAHSRKYHNRQMDIPKREPVATTIRKHGVRVMGVEIEKALIKEITNR